MFNSSDLVLAADSTHKVNFVCDSQNYITQLFQEQLPSIQTGILNVHLSKGCIVEPHWDTNAAELTFVISGEIMTSVFNPSIQQLMTYKLKPGQASQFPKGWFHWIVALSDHVHFLAIFDVLH